VITEISMGCKFSGLDLATPSPSPLSVTQGTGSKIVRKRDRPLQTRDHRLEQNVSITELRNQINRTLTPSRPPNPCELTITIPSSKVMDDICNLGPKKALGYLFDRSFRIPLSEASEARDQTGEYLKDIPSCEDDEVGHHS
jgi:hypothetical protein